MADNWQSPTGFVDPDTAWNNETNIYNDDEGGSYGDSETPGSNWGSFVELTISAISCDKVRFMALYQATMHNQIDLDVYYNSAWNNVYEGSYSNQVWEEKSLGATYTVTAARARFYNAYFSGQIANFYEFDFNQITVSAKKKNIIFVGSNF